MIIEIRKSFEKDAIKLPAPVQVQLASILQQIISAKKLSDLSSCKKLTDLRVPIELDLEVIVLVFSLKMKR